MTFLLSPLFSVKLTVIKDGLKISDTTSGNNPVNTSVPGTERLWNRRFRRDLSGEEARQLTKNVLGFFRVLAEWSHAEQSPANLGNGGEKPDGRWQ
jgi:hypothetical protein